MGLFKKRGERFKSLEDRVHDLELRVTIIEEDQLDPEQSTPPESGDTA
jgi:hypothetical protein